MTKPNIIAIDGPAASGKSTLGKNLAMSLGYLFFDTGVMYRAVTWLVLQRNLDAYDEVVVTALTLDIQIEVKPPSKDDGRACDVLVDGQDITWDTRRKEVEGIVSIISTYAGVRKELAAQQRRIGLRGRVVMVGRDIGTVVLPEADLKIFLDASAEVRARRRYDELVERGMPASYEDILANVIGRDKIDSTRAVAPLVAAKDAIILDTDKMNIEEVFSYVETLCK
jgi:cytidylate kinase